MNRLSVICIDAAESGRTCILYYSTKTPVSLDRYTHASGMMVGTVNPHANTDNLKNKTVQLVSNVECKQLSYVKVSSDFDGILQ